MTAIDLASELETLRARTREYLGLVTSQLRSAPLTERRRLLDERAFYPAHAPRKKTTEYTRVQRAMVVDEDQPCRICDVRASTLPRFARNPYRASRMEAHHSVIEWAAATAIDLDRFHQCVVTPLAQTTPARYAQLTTAGAPRVRRDGTFLPRRFTRAEMLAWIDHDRDNLWVLCDVHHRSAWFGVHAISAPVWEAQRYLRREFAGAVLEELSRDPRPRPRATRSQPRAAARRRAGD